ncbi:MAG: hypothetical protein HYZ83_03315 [Candidatus Omnitrophica bacterium]|nr:hypothetical protein [Candidatus Omnitrophota bacterium]
MEAAANRIRAGGEGIRLVKRNPVKLTALLYLREALLKERYEECAEIVAIAQEFGAGDFEIRNILEDPRRTIRA